MGKIMNENETRALGALIREKAKEYGADLAGISDVEALKNSPSHVISHKLPPYKCVGVKNEEMVNVHPNIFFMR